MYGSDQAASIEPHGLRQLVEQLEKLKYLCDGIKKITKGEYEVANKFSSFINNFEEWKIILE